MEKGRYGLPTVIAMIVGIVIGSGIFFKSDNILLATGGSVVYRPEAMRYLTSLGPVVFLDVPLPLILERISRKPDRGLAIAPGQTVEDLFREREALYRQWATCRVAAGDIDVSETANAVFDAIAGCGQAL